MSFKLEIRSANPWNKIFSKGIPGDLRQPYPNFDIFLQKILKCNAKKVLDIAMGAGRHSIVMGNSGLIVYGFDISDEAIKLAKKEFKQQKIEPQLLKADMFDKYPYRDNFFDAVVAIQAIYHGFKEDMEQALAEIHRVLAPNGIFAFTISLKRDRSSLGATICKAKKVALRTYIPLTGREKGLPHFYPTRIEIKKMLSENFKEIDIAEDKTNSYYAVTCKNR